MKSNNHFLINSKNIVFSSLVSLVVPIVTVAIGMLITLQATEQAFETVVGLLANFSLTFLGFLIASFTLLQIIESKEWIEQVKTTEEYTKLLSAFKLLIFGTAIGLFFSVFLQMGASLIETKLLYLVFISLSTWIMAFLVIFAWKTVSTIIVLFRL